MGRRSKASLVLTRKIGQSTSAAAPFKQANVAALTARFRETAQGAFADAVDACVELGRILHEAKPVLGNDYSRWLREVLHVADVTATNYTRLAALARDSPALIERFKYLGPSKLYRIARLEPDARHKILKRTDLALLNSQQFAAIPTGRVVRKVKVTGNMKANGFRMRLRAFKERASDYKPRIENPDMRESVRAEIAELVEILRALSQDIG